MEERKRILKMVEEGKLSVEEAMVLLESLDKGKYQTVQDVSTYVDYDQAQTNSKQESKQYSVKEKLTDFLESTIKKIKDVDLDFNFGPSFEVNHIFQQKDVFLSEIDIDIANGEVKLLPWDEKDIRIECKAQVFRVANQEEAKRAFLKDSRFSIDGGRMRFSLQKKQMKVATVFYIPQEDYKRIKVRMFNGHISGEGLLVQDFEAKTANGKINMLSSKTNEIELETANGHIQIHHCQGKQVEAETLNGKVHLIGSFDKVDLQSFNGNIICDIKESKCHTVFLKSKAGNIDCIVPKEIEIDGELKSNIGKFTCELAELNVIHEKKDVVMKEYKFIANKGLSHTLHLEAESTAGSIFIKQK